MPIQSRRTTTKVFKIRWFSFSRSELMAKYGLDEWAKVAGIVQTFVDVTRLGKELYIFFSGTGADSKSQTQANVAFEKSVLTLREQGSLTDQQYLSLQVAKQDYFAQALRIWQPGV